jgi:L-seryl-tRNA(Ser) seleniumtransferase
MKVHEYAGARVVLAGNNNGATEDEMSAAITDRTAAILFTFAYGDPPGGLTLPEVVKIARTADVPVIVDGAAMLPPKTNLTKYIDEGADLVTYSGGKYIGGPQSTGLLAGRADLIEAALMNSGPHMAIGRPQKVGREDMIGMATALQLFVESDDESRQVSMRKKAEYINECLQGIDGISSSVEQDFKKYHVPNCVIRFDQGQGRIDEIWEALHEGTPRIYIARNPGGLAANMVNLQDGEEKLVARRLVEILSK